MKPKYKRLLLIIISLVSITIGSYIIGSVFKDNIIFFYSPSELDQAKIGDKIIRIGGLVKEDSIKQISGGMVFTLTDNREDIEVEYYGILPNLFREKQGIVAKGRLLGSQFMASELLTKHDENYMPKEVADSLKEEGLYKHANDKSNR